MVDTFFGFDILFNFLTGKFWRHVYSCNSRELTTASYPSYVAYPIPTHPGYTHDYHDIIIRNHVLIARRYIRSWLFIDFLSTFPLDKLIGSSGETLKLIKIFRLARLIKLVRLLKFDKIISNFEEAMEINPGYIRLFKLLGEVLMLIHIFTCIWHSTTLRLLDSSQMSSLPSLHLLFPNVSFISQYLFHFVAFILSKKLQQTAHIFYHFRTADASVESWLHLYAEAYPHVVDSKFSRYFSLSPFIPKCPDPRHLLYFFLLFIVKGMFAQCTGW